MCSELPAGMRWLRHQHTHLSAGGPELRLLMLKTQHTSVGSL